jgi:DNA ligase 1
LEGIMAKKLNGKYEAGARGWNWIKYKHSYSSKLADTIDCLVMGYDFGKGKRTDFGLGAFLVGVYDQITEKFVTVAKIGTGLTDQEWRELKVQSQKLKVKTKPENYLINKLQVCDQWLKPGIIVEIRSDEITKSPAHTAKLALRFPRLEKFRGDKDLNEITNLVELENLFQNQRQINK